MTGRIERINREKYYAFLTAEDVSSKVFMHASALRNRNLSELREGDYIDFQLVRTPKGPRAEHVTVLS